MWSQKSRAGHQTVHFIPYNGTSQVMMLQPPLGPVRLLRLESRELGFFRHLKKKILIMLPVSNYCNIIAGYFCLALSVQCWIAMTVRLHPPIGGVQLVSSERCTIKCSKHEVWYISLCSAPPMGTIYESSTFAQIVAQCMNSKLMNICCRPLR